MSENRFDISPAGLNDVLQQIAPCMVTYALPSVNELIMTDLCHVEPFCRDGGGAPFYSISTSKEEYYTGCKTEIDSLRHQGGKTVYSRVIAGRSERPVAEATSELFKRLPDTFRFIARTPDGQLWIGASPELLLDNRPAEGILFTCALAGTRSCRVDSTQQWDNKNIAEHRMVVDFILSALESMDLVPAAGVTGTRVYGRAVHLHTPIQARSTSAWRSLLDRLSPTPALAGYPRAHALERIKSIEHHRRGYYGGYVAVELPDGRTVAYVNLRSMRVKTIDDSGFEYNIFVGGGLTADSDPTTEWNETSLKAGLLLDIVNYRVKQPR